MGHSDDTRIWGGEYEYEYGGLYSTQDFQSNRQVNQTVCDQEYHSKRIRLSPESDNLQEVDEDAPREEPGPLGLRLTKSASFLNLVRSRLRKGKNAAAGDHKVDDDVISTKKMDELGCQEKMKASNFPVYYIRIGGWKKVSRHEGDVTAKLYFAKKKLVWEVLEGALKSKIEIQWSDISGIRGMTPDNECGTLEIEVKQPPQFFRELNPQPRKHTLWQPSCDFTGGQAPTVRRHYLLFPPGILDKHYHNLLHSDQRLYQLSCAPFPTHASPFFDSTILQVSQVSSLLLNNNPSSSYNHHPPSSSSTTPPPHHHIDPTIILPRPTLPLPLPVGPVLPLPVLDYGVGSSSSSSQYFPCAGSQGCFISHEQQQPTVPVVAETYGVGNSSQYFPASWDIQAQGFISHYQQHPTPVVAESSMSMQQQFPPPTTTNYNIVNTTEALYPQQLNWQQTTTADDSYTNLLMGQGPQITHANSFFFPDVNLTNEEGEGEDGNGGGGGGFF